jgi:hypothetical protein
MLNQPVLVLPSFWMSSAALRPQTLQNVAVETPVNRFAWRKKLPVKNPLKVKKKNCHHHLMFDFTSDMDRTGLIP